MPASGMHRDCPGPLREPVRTEAAASRSLRGEDDPMAFACPIPARLRIRHDIMNGPSHSAACVEIAAKRPSAPKERNLP